MKPFEFVRDVLRSSRRHLEKRAYTMLGTDIVLLPFMAVLDVIVLPFLIVVMAISGILWLIGRGVVLVAEKRGA